MKKLLLFICCAALLVPAFAFNSMAATIKYDSTAQFSGKQGENNWYYLFGPGPGQYKEFTNYDDTNLKWFDNRANTAECKPDAAHPGGDNDANLQQTVYAWKAPSDGSATLQGEVEKFGQKDNNPAWPDGIAIKIYQNTQLISTTNVAVKEGDGNNTKATIAPKTVSVKKDDFIYFAVDPKANNAWDFTLVHFTLQLETAGGGTPVSSSPTTASTNTGSSKTTVAAGTQNTTSALSGMESTTAVTSEETTTQQSTVGTISTTVKGSTTEAPANTGSSTKSGSPVVFIVIAILVVLGGGGAAFYFLYFKKKQAAGK